MRQAIQECCRQVGFPKNLRPVSKTRIGGHNHGFALMTFSQHLKEQFCADLRKRHIPSFIQNQKIIARIACEYLTLTKVL